MFEYLIETVGKEALIAIPASILIFTWLYFDIKRRREWHAGRKNRMRLLKEEAIEKLQAERDAADKTK